MNVFEGVRFGQDKETLADVMAIIANKLSEMEPPYSLCELRLDVEDYQWLCDWASAVEPSTIEGLVKDTTLIIRKGESLPNFIIWKDALGCMFLLLASETARREAPESSLWPFVANKFSLSVRSTYFEDSAYPDASIRDATEEAIRQMELRHVLDENDTQKYFVSARLQFGFTRQGMSSLARWLVEHPSTRAVQLLRGEVGNMTSESFCAMWSALRNYRNGNILEARARAVLEDSPWVLPEWIDEALEQANKRLPARYHPRDDGLDIFGNPHDQTEDRRQRRRRADRFLTRPALRWDGGTVPRFESSVINLNRLGLTTDRYTVRDDNAVLAYIIRTEDSSYGCSQDAITIRSDTPYVHLSLSDDYGETHLSQQFDLWDVTEDVELFDLRNGGRLDDAYEAPLNPNADYGLLISPDLRVEPDGLPFASVGIGGEGKTLVRFRSDECDAVRVLLDEFELWSYRPERKITSARRDEEEPQWVVAVGPQMPYKANSSPAGEEQYLFDVIVSGGEVSLVAVRLGNMQLDIDYVDGVYRTKSFRACSHYVMCR